MNLISFIYNKTQNRDEVGYEKTDFYFDFFVGYKFSDIFFLLYWKY
jgi:hypothetical protein